MSAEQKPLSELMVELNGSEPMAVLSIWAIAQRSLGDPSWRMGDLADRYPLDGDAKPLLAELGWDAGIAVALMFESRVATTYAELEASLNRIVRVAGPDRAGAR